MSGEMVKVGDEVELTIRGKVVRDDDHDGCHKIEAVDFYQHYVYLGEGSSTLRDGETNRGVTAKIIEAPFVPGKAYVDGDGEVFIRTRDGAWLSYTGSMFDDNYPTKPIRLLT